MNRLIIYMCVCVYIYIYTHTHTHIHFYTFLARLTKREKKDREGRNKHLMNNSIDYICNKT